MVRDLILSIDAMGGDAGPASILGGAALACLEAGLALSLPAASGLAVPRLKRPTTGYCPRARTRACEISAPTPLASKTPVKQIPFAWLRR